MILERGTRPIPDNSFREATLAQAGIKREKAKKKARQEMSRLNIYHQRRITVTQRISMYELSNILTYLSSQFTHLSAIISALYTT